VLVFGVDRLADDMRRSGSAILARWGLGCGWHSSMKQILIAAGMALAVALLLTSC